MDKIARIRQEIKRLRKEIKDDKDPLAPNQKAGYLFALADVESFLNTLSEGNERTLFEEIVYPGSFGEFVAGLNPPPKIPKMKVDKDLEEAAEEYSKGIIDRENSFMCKAAFEAGAEWMANQGISFEDKVYPTTDWKGDIDGYCIDGTEEVDLMSEAVPKGLFQVGDKVIVQIRKKEDNR